MATGNMHKKLGKFIRVVQRASVPEKQNITNTLNGFDKYRHFASMNPWQLYEANFKPVLLLTSPQSNLRRAHRKGPIGSDDSQVRDRPLPGKPLTPNITLR